MSEKFSYAEALKNLRDKIALPELEIQSSHIRKSANGGIIIEIPGENKSLKADRLRDMTEVLGNTAKVTRPSIKGELRIIGMDDLVVTDEVADVVAANGGCKVEEIKVGLIRPMQNGLFTVWVSCPLGAAVKAAKSGKIRIGWTVAKVEMLKARSTLCYRCWSQGHLQVHCNSKIDRTDTCYRYGTKGHRASECQGTICCILCKEMGREHDHRVGSARYKMDTPTRMGNPPKDGSANTPMETEEEPARRAEESMPL